MSTEVIGFTCKSCGKKYKVKANMAGKAAKCPGCGTALKIPGENSAPVAASAQRTAASNDGPAKAAQSQAKAAQSKATPTQRPQTASGKELGLEGPLRNEADVFSGAGEAPANPKQNPLGNHVITDPGFGSGDTGRVELEAEPDEDQFARNPIVVEREKAEADALRQYKAIAATKPDEPEWEESAAKAAILIVAFAGVLVLITFVFGFTMSKNTGALVGGIGLVVFGLVTTGVQIWGIVLVAKTDPNNPTLQVLLFLFVPFYNIIYPFLNWSNMKGYFFALLACMLSQSLVMTAFIVVTAFGKSPY